MKGNHLLAAVSGATFAVGLAIGGMLEPARVVGFLDFFGTWDPTLAFVMGGALAVSLPVHQLTMRKRTAPVFDDRFHLPTNELLEPRLILGSVIFGAGWALAGYCPGPALTTLATGTFDALAFVAAMALGMYAWAFFEGRLRSRDGKGRRPAGGPAA